MNKLIQVAIVTGALLVGGCGHLSVTTRLNPDGSIKEVVVDRWSCWQKFEFQKIEIPNIATIEGYKNDGGESTMSEAGILASKITEGAVKGAVEGAK